MQDFAGEVIRPVQPSNSLSFSNFSIIAHIDHGKSTLADRYLTNTIQRSELGKNKQVLDKLKVERERGLQAQTASMFYTYKSRTYLLNLIDTPGHVDFSWEVSRSLAACQGALLLVDASQGIQAQTISVFHIAREKGLKIIPILNKIDLPAADVERVMAQMETVFGTAPEDVLLISAKSGHGVSDVLQAIVERVPAPTSRLTDPLKALLFDSSYDRYRGVVSLINVQGGTLSTGDKIQSSHTRKKYEIIDIGIMHPEEVSTSHLRAGQVGYIACNMKQHSEAHIGDTLHRVGESVEPLPGFTPTKAMVFAGVYPVDSNDFPKLEESIQRLTLTDRSVTVQRDSSTALGQGLRLGFFGTLHMDVFRQRLEDEYNANIIITAPTVPYKIVYKDRTRIISNPTEFPDVQDPRTQVVEVQEPMVKASIIVPHDYLGEMIDLCTSHRAEELDHKFLDVSVASSRIMISCIIPLSEIVTDFFDKLKSRSSGFASFDYEDAGYRRSKLGKMSFLLNHKPVDALALVVHMSAAAHIGQTWVKKLTKVIPRQLFELAIQASVGNKVVARGNLSALRKDVTAGLYGGHHERKLKHLENQKKSKKRMKRVAGSIDLPQEAFYEILSSRKAQ
ncbi:P-loop containing nucleoside triphosphate hydrolase protein [Gautieria morchelliformis]|nr:P-loop containing nucleoside triphosphate hydrolase protein [Gautieria morchelliformis]